MKTEERIAASYLQNLNLGNVVFEPHGQTTPDFVIDGRIAVEVRRLNQYYQGDGSQPPVALENLAHTVTSIVTSAVESFGPPLPDDGHGPRNWGIYYTYERTGSKPKGLDQAIRKALDSIKNNRATGLQNVQLIDGFTMYIAPYPILKPQMFTVIGDGDQNSGGMLMNIYQESLDLAVAEKWGKVSRSPHYATYTEWWLVLIDTVGFGMDEYDRGMFLGQVSVDPGFQRVVLVPPGATSEAVDVPIR